MHEQNSGTKSALKYGTKFFSYQNENFTTASTWGPCMTTMSITNPEKSQGDDYKWGNEAIQNNMIPKKDSEIAEHGEKWLPGQAWGTWDLHSHHPSDHHALG